VPIYGVGKLRQRLDRLALGLKRAASGDVAHRAAEKVGEMVRRIAEDKLSKHVASGAALAATKVDVRESLVQLYGMPPAKGAQWSGRSYVRFHGWWPFRRLRMPSTILRAASLILARELLAALRGQTGSLGTVGYEALILVAEDETAEEKKSSVRAARQGERALEKGRRAFKKEIARIYRQSAEGKAARSAARKAARGG